MATRTIEDVLSAYSYPTKDEMERNKKECLWVVPELFYVYGPPYSETSLKRVQRRHLYTKEVDAYSVGKVAQPIWEDEWDKELFKSTVGASIFLYKLHQLQHEDPKNRPSLASILEIFTSALNKIKLPDCCFRYKI
jgi:hypothetical protein